MKYKVTGIEKKAFLGKVAELAGEKMHYEGIPSYAYTLPGITLDQDMTLTVVENADTELIEKLVAEGLLELKEEEPVPETAEEAAEGETAEENAGEDVEEQAEGSELITPQISFPISQHKAESICNLVFTLYAKGELMSRSTGGRFDATQEIVDALREKRAGQDGMLEAIKAKIGQYQNP